MGTPPKKPSNLPRFIVVALILVALTGIAAVSVVPPMIFQNQVKAGMEAIVRTPVDVGDVEIALDFSTGHVNDVVIHNPAGYTGDRFMEIPRVTFEVAESTVDNAPVRFTHITLHDPVLHLETKGETSNLKEMIETMLQPGGEPTPPVVIDELRIERGTIHAVFEYGDGQPVVSDFPLDTIENLHGHAGEIAGQIAKALQHEMDAQVKEAARALDEGFLQRVKAMFKKD